MKNFLLFLSILFFAGCWFAHPANAEYRSSNSHYQAIHVRHMAQRNFTNNGRSKYVYVKQKVGQYDRNSTEVGAVQLEKNSRIRELNIAVDMTRINRIKPWDRNKKLSISHVSGGGKHLKKINVIVNSNGRLNY